MAITGNRHDFYFLSPLRVSQPMTDYYPRLARPRLGLDSDRCFAAGYTALLSPFSGLRRKPLKRLCIFMGFLIHLAEARCE
jgi:hypothetical protein